MRPNKLYLIGAGRHSATRQLRRANRFSRRVIRVGELMISHRRIDVDAAFVEKHLKVIIAHMRKGTLIVAHSGDSFVDEAELCAMFDAAPIESEIDIVDETGDSGEDIELTDEEKAAILTEMDDLSDEAKSEIVEFGGYVPSAAEIADLRSEEADTGFEEAAELAPTDVAEPDAATAGEPSPVKTSKELPDISAMTKKQLIALCEELGIEVKGSPNNATLHDMLNEWKNS